VGGIVVVEVDGDGDGDGDVAVREEPMADGSRPR